MSGIEIAGLALGAVPVLLEAIKGYKDTYDHIQDFKHATPRLQIIDAQFRVCRINFLSECRLLLNLVLSDHQLSQEMIGNTQHDLWQDVVVERQLADLLHDDISACATIVKDTSATIQAFDARLSKLHIPPKSASSTMQRARVSATFMMEKSRFERDIATLRKRNADLNLMRSHFSAPEAHHHVERSINTDGQNKVKKLASIRLASGLLHDTLKTAWSCLDATHVRHWAKLCVDSEPSSVTDTVTLDMAISSEVVKQQQRDEDVSAVWLYVRSESMQSPAAASQSNKAGARNAFVQTLRESSSRHSSVTAPASTAAATGMTGETHDVSNTVDLCNVRCVCSHFQSILSSQVTHQEKKCLGYLTSPSSSRYLFFGPSTPGKVKLPTSAMTPDKVTDLQDLIDRPQTLRLQLLHQYQLALKLSRSVLQFHNTAWLPSVWKLVDLSILGSTISEQSLKTLHLSTRFERASVTASTGTLGTASSSTSTASTMLASPTAVDACCKKLSPGVYNETLFSLGIALLEIAHWQTFEKLRQGDPDEFYAAHRIVRGPPPLGPKYRKIVERCLRCDFGTGSEDLEDDDLQRAVWSKVVYPLEALVQDIS